VRDIGDNAGALHFAAANGNAESVRLLLDAGADVHGTGDLHAGDVIGWASHAGNQAVIDLLLERGARHHIFSAMALGDVDLVERLVDEDPQCLARRRSRFESGQTPLHAAFAPPDGLGYLRGEPDYAMLQRLIELGADLDAVDDKGRTPLAVAMLRGDREAARLLTEAGATEPSATDEDVAPFSTQIAATAKSVKKTVPMFSVRDMRATVKWYESIGFSVHDRYEDGGDLMFARLTFGDGELTLSPGGKTGPREVSLWFFTDRVRELYALLKARQLASAAGGPDRGDGVDVRFQEDLYEPFYGGLQFSVLDNNGMPLIFRQLTWFAPART
jgi:ankyrin repeat protein/catechol 2,3-dioxygenase-like lactoylglutathione lyase family enzyme